MSYFDGIALQAHAVSAEALKAQLKMRQLIEDKARREADLPETHDIFVSTIVRWSFGHEEISYPNIYLSPAKECVEGQYIQRPFSHAHPCISGV